MSIKCLFAVLTIMVAVSVRGQMLYSVKGRHLKGESYILFVDNMLPSNALVGVKNVFRCYNRTDVVVCETMEDEPDNLREMMKSQSPLTDNLSQEEFVMVDSVLKTDVRMSPGKVMRLKPAAISMLWKSEICRSLYWRDDGDLSMDSYFQYAALMEGRRIIALDSTLHAYDYLMEDIDLQTRAMVDGFRLGRKAVEDSCRKSYSLFMCGDVRGLGRMQTEKDLSATVDMWIDKLVSVMKKDKCFVVMYAKYHNSGLIDKLKKKGLKIKEVK